MHRVIASLNKPVALGPVLAMLLSFFRSLLLVTFFYFAGAFVGYFLVSYIGSLFSSPSLNIDWQIVAGIALYTVALVSTPLYLVVAIPLTVGHLKVRRPWIFILTFGFSLLAWFGLHQLVWLALLVIQVLLWGYPGL